MKERQEKKSLNYLNVDTKWRHWRMQRDWHTAPIIRCTNTCRFLADRLHRCCNIDLW